MQANKGLLAALAALLLLAGECFALVEPCRNYRRISGEFMERRDGHYHKGLDYSLPVGSEIYAADSGTVVWSGPQGTFGLLVKIGHSNGYTTYYGHLRRTKVSVGDFVHPGDVIGLSGNSGRSTGPHLHFEVRDASGAVDPTLWLAGAYPGQARLRAEGPSLLSRGLVSLAGPIGATFAQIEERFGEELPPALRGICAAMGFDADTGGAWNALGVLVQFFVLAFATAISLFAVWHAMRLPMRFLKWIFGPAGP
ncbi:MAG: M23 family metallopeptidase [Fibrobacterales bacterium]|nr:M23 family metallopeptidase [Fibrobacterales bacterium]